MLAFCNRGACPCTVVPTHAQTDQHTAQLQAVCISSPHSTMLSTGQHLWAPAATHCMPMFRQQVVAGTKHRYYTIPAIQTVDTTVTSTIKLQKCGACETWIGVGGGIMRMPWPVGHTTAESRPSAVALVQPQKACLGTSGCRHTSTTSQHNFVLDTQACMCAC